MNCHFKGDDFQRVDENLKRCSMPKQKDAMLSSPTFLQMSEETDNIAVEENVDEHLQKGPQ